MPGGTGPCRPGDGDGTCAAVARELPSGVASRRRLSQIQLTGVRAALRSVAFGLVAVTAAVAALGYVLPAHRLRDEATFHSNLADGGPASLVVLGVVIGVWLVLRARPHGAGYVLGVVAAGGAVGAVIPVFLTHLFSTVTSGVGEALFAIGVVGLFGVGAGLLVLEPILYLGQRRQLERDVDPQFPTARIVS